MQRKFKEKKIRRKNIGRNQNFRLFEPRKNCKEKESSKISKILNSIKLPLPKIPTKFQISLSFSI